MDAWHGATSNQEEDVNGPEKLKEALCRYGAQTRCAAALGVTPTTIHAYTTGKQRPSLRTAVQLWAYTGGAVSPQDWIDDRDWKGLLPAEQPDPRNDGVDVIADLILCLPGLRLNPEAKGALARALAFRRTLGISRYGQPLMSNDGRDTLRDLNDELLDAAAYAWSLHIKEGAEWAGVAEALLMMLVGPAPDATPAPEAE
jgi:DNA-binding transcriptional regulator YdaS (Cro superfamily)